MDYPTEVLRALTGLGVLSLLGLWAAMLLILASAWRVFRQGRLLLTVMATLYFGLSLLWPHPLIRAFRRGESGEPLDVLRTVAMAAFWMVVTYFLPRWVRQLRARS